MNVEQIEAFLYVSITGNFSKAGEILYISQPTVSARIKSLERELGYQLFYRNGKNITLTKEGEEFLPYAKIALENIQAGLLAMNQMSSTKEGELNISIVLTMSNYILPILIRDFHKAFPKIKLTIYTGHSHNVLEMVLNREVSLGISRSVSHRKIDTIHLIEDEMVLAIYPNHPFSLRKSISLEEVADEPLILYNRGSIDWTLINNTFRNLNIKPNVIMEADNIELVKQMVKQMVKQGIGLGILPRSSIEEELLLNNLCLLEINDLPHLSRPYQLIFLKETKFEGILKTFVDFICEKITYIK